MDWFAAPDYTLARQAITQVLGAVYLFAFVAAWHQNRSLIGERGLTPIPRFLTRVPFRAAPSLFHIHYSDRLADGTAVVGAALSVLAVAGLPLRGPMWLPLVWWLVIWALYLSIVNVGQVWYGFGWESILLEAGFFAAFLGSADAAPPWLTILMIRWLLFRVEFGAGLIKMRGDPCWRDLTCLYYHHETQPIPNPMSWWFHHLPKRFHRIEVGANHVVQLGLPFLLFTPQPGPTVAAVAIIATQGWLMLSGNFAWLNAVTMTLAVSGLPDDLLSRLPVLVPEAGGLSPGWFEWLVVAVAGFVVVMSWRPVANMASRRQRMNMSFNPLHLVGTYGAFGTVTRDRNEIVLEATLDEPDDPDARWMEYEFWGKPTDPRRRPVQIAPYHLRLDWLMWFAAMSPPGRYPWLGQLLDRLAAADPMMLRLLRTDPCDGARPAAVRARFYNYRYTSRAERKATGAWWHRTELGLYLPPTAAG